MTGTALTEATEFRKIYKLPVVQIPTNRPMVRADHNDQVYKSKDGSRIGFRAPTGVSGLTVPGGDPSGLPGLMFVTRSDSGQWQASDGCV